MYDNQIRELRQNETGFGYLYERDAGFIDNKLNKDLINENFKVEKGKPLLINCVLQKYGVENKNTRIYPETVLKPQVEVYQNLITNNSAASEADHPDSNIISLHNISHLITKMWWGTGEQKHILFGTLKLLVTRGYIEQGIVSVVGDKILFYLENGMRIGISSRGLGSVKLINGKNIVQDDFELIGFDLVSSPSTPGAYLFPNVHNIETHLQEKNNINNKTSMNENNKLIQTVDRFLL